MRLLLNVGARARKNCFPPLFKVAKSLQKATSNVRTIVCSSKYYEDDFRY